MAFGGPPSALRRPLGATPFFGSGCAVYRLVHLNARARSAPARAQERSSARALLREACCRGPPPRARKKSRLRARGSESVPHGCVICVRSVPARRMDVRVVLWRSVYPHHSRWCCTRCWSRSTRAYSSRSARSRFMPRKTRPAGRCRARVEGPSPAGWWASIEVLSRWKPRTARSGRAGRAPAQGRVDALRERLARLTYAADKATIRVLSSRVYRGGGPPQALFPCC